MPSAPLDNEHGLLRQLSRGDEQAFRKIFDHYRGKIYSYAFHLTDSVTLAEEIVQETFLKLWINRQKLTEINSFSSWLHIISRNLVFDSLKQLAKESAAKYHLAFAESFADEAGRSKFSVICDRLC